MRFVHHHDVEASRPPQQGRSHPPRQPSFGTGRSPFAEEPGAVPDTPDSRQQADRPPQLRTQWHSPPKGDPSRPPRPIGMRTQLVRVPTRRPARRPVTEGSNSTSLSASSTRPTHASASALEHMNSATEASIARRPPGAVIRKASAARPWCRCRRMRREAHKSSACMSRVARQISSARSMFSSARRH